MRRPIILDGFAASCYFRSSVQPPYRKAIVQITERCDLRCAHCFVSAQLTGNDMPLETINEYLIPRLRDCRVTSVTITGGEPFVHPNILGIVAVLRDAGFRVGICTNAASITSDQVSALQELGGVHLNVSLDGFRAESHGRFRGKPASFHDTVRNMELLGERKLLQGVLVTPNSLAAPDEYRELTEFARRCGASYVLMNPLSSFGRGVRSKGQLEANAKTMQEVRDITLSAADGLEMVHIRFPNQDLPLTGCSAGDIFYVFVNGNVAICPYLVFAASAPGSKHTPAEFIAGNIISDSDLAFRLDSYPFQRLHSTGSNRYCSDCEVSTSCGRGCPAAVIATGQQIGEVDAEVCPKVHANPEA